MKQTRKYFFFDYDGTLTAPGTYFIPENTKATLRALEEAGHMVFLATGRLQINALEYIAEANITNIVADGGYSVTIDGDLKWMKPLPIEAVRACLRRLDEVGIPWAVTTANELLRYSNNPDFEHIAGDYYLPTKYIEGLTGDSLEEVYKIYIPCTPEQEAFVLATGALDNVPWVRYNPDALFVEPMDKQEGIKWVMDYYGAPYKDAVVFGDGKNDLSMFIPEWTSIAMGNAVSALKERASYVTAPSADDGITKACQHFGWI